MIELKGIHKTYRSEFYEANVLKGIDLTIEKGEFVSVMGASGSGKTTLLNIIGLIDECNEGSVEIAGTVVTKKNRENLRKEHISYVFQHFALIETDTVYENIELPLLAQGVSKKKRKKTIGELLEKMDIVNLKNQLPTKISGGQKQRVAIARALAANTDIILADEPTGALDEANTQAIIDIFRQLVKEGKTVIFVTHDKEVADKTDRIIVIEDGKLVK